MGDVMEHDDIPSELLQRMVTSAPAQKAEQRSKVVPEADNSLEAQIAAQGEKVREMKRERVDVAILKPEIDILLALKQKFAAASGAQNETKPAAQKQGKKAEKA